MSATQITKIRAWHEELVEFMLAHPRASLAETSIYFNVSISWLSIIKNTDAFRELWSSRRGEHFSNVSASVTERVTALAEVTVDALTAKIEKEINSPDGVKIETLRDVSEMALKSLGFGPKGNNTPSGPLVQNNYFVDKDTLARAREARRQTQINADHLKLLEATVVEEGELIEPVQISR